MTSKAIQIFLHFTRAVADDSYELVIKKTFYPKLLFAVNFNFINKTHILTLSLLVGTFGVC